MIIDEFLKILDADFFTGVPDSLLKPLCNKLYAAYGQDPKHHIIAANEGNAVALAAGYHLATGKVPVVYMQNSGEGNAINPIASLLDPAVYGIPVLFIIGWRGEPGVHDEPQHVKQGQVTIQLMEDLGIDTFALDANTTNADFQRVVETWRSSTFPEGKSAAVIVRKNAFNKAEINFTNEYPLTRESIIEMITAVSGDDPIISTTGKASRELFEIRERHQQRHGLDFLTVGSMGHASSIAAAVALQSPAERVWCIDGDGAAIMHMGAMAVIAQAHPSNLVHIVINNEAHETVGGLPTAAGSVDLCGVAKSCGYDRVYSVANPQDLSEVLNSAQEDSALTFIEVKSAIGSRPDLGRPTTTAKENKEAFMQTLHEKQRRL